MNGGLPTRDSNNITGQAYLILLSITVNGGCAQLDRINILQALKQEATLRDLTTQPMEPFLMETFGVRKESPIAHGFLVLRDVGTINAQLSFYLRSG